MLPSLIDRLGDAKDSVREQDQTLLLKIMDQAANPQVRGEGVFGPLACVFLQKVSGFQRKIPWPFIRSPPTPVKDG